MEWFFVLLFLVGVIGAYVQHRDKVHQAAERDRIAEEHRSILEKRYAQDPFKEDILRGTIRVGMTAQQLRDAWGPPAAIDERVLKTKVVHTYKYAQTGRSFRQRVKVENGIVVGWTNT